MCEQRYLLTLDVIGFQSHGEAGALPMLLITVTWRVPAENNNVSL